MHSLCPPSPNKTWGFQENALSQCTMHRIRCQGLRNSSNKIWGFRENAIIKPVQCTFNQIESGVFISLWPCTAYVPLSQNKSGVFKKIHSLNLCSNTASAPPEILPYLFVHINDENCLFEMELLDMFIEC